MFGSWVCWQLVLGWALILGQPVFGNPDAGEEPPLDESEEPVPVLQEPVSEEPVLESQEPEDPASELKEPMDLMLGDSLDPRVQMMLGRHLPYEELKLILGPSNEELEKRVREEREWLERARDSPYDDSLRYLMESALRHYNQESNYLYTSYENGNMKVKKAIGTTIYVKFLLVKTNCTKEEGEALLRQRMMLFYDDEKEMMDNPLSTEKKHCEVPPESEQEIEECTFTLFRDARSRYRYRYTVTDHSCVPFDRQRENEY